MHAHASCRAHTQLLSATEGCATSLYFIIISLGIFRGCKGIPGGARPLKLSTPPPSSLPFPPPCTLSLALSLSLSLSLSESLSSSISLFFSFSHRLFPLPFAGFPSLQFITSRMHYKKKKKTGSKPRRELGGDVLHMEKCLRELSHLLLLQP